MQANRPWRKIRGVFMALVVAAGAAVAVHPAQPALADAAGDGGDYVSFGSSIRVLDTGNGVGAPKAKIGVGGTVTFQVTGFNNGQIPTSNIRAVLVDITSKAPTANTFLTLWPDGTSRPGTGNLNVMAGEQLSNSAVVQVGANGKVSVYNQYGTTDVLVDVQGYFTTITGASGPGGFVPVTANTTVASGAIAANTTKTFTVPGTVAPAGSPAVFADVIVDPEAAGWLGSTPTGGSGAYSTLEFGTVVHSSGAVIRLAADGRFNLTNHSTKPISIYVRVQGYFTSTSTTGAGLRPIIKRLHDTTIPAGTTVDIAIGGTANLPIKGIAGAALNFTMNTATASGFLKAWPVGAAEPGSSVGQFQLNKHRTGMAIIKPGTEGKIRLKNSATSGSVRVYTDLQGWFADPLPVIPTAPDSPTVGVQAKAEGTSLGSLTYAFVDEIGRLRLGHQPTPDNFANIQWSVANSTNAYTGKPGISAYNDGRIQVTAQNSDGNYWVASQAVKNEPTFNAFGDIGGSMASTPTQITFSNGTTVNFGVDSDGKLWHHRVVTGSTSYWRSLTDQDLVGPLSYVTVDQGVQLFARDQQGSVRTALYATDGAIGAWTNLAATGVTETPSAVVYPGNRLRVFVRAGDGTVQTKLQDPSGAWPAGWQAVGTRSGNPFVVRGAPQAILDPVSGRTTVIARSTDDEVLRVVETAPGAGTFGEWGHLNEAQIATTATDPTLGAVTGRDGQTFFIAYRNINGTNVVWYRDPLNTGSSAKVSARAAAAPQFTAHELPAPPVD